MTYERNTMYEQIREWQAAAEDRILQNWIATQTLAQDAPAFRI
jgi:hypothetical protein